MEDKKAQATAIRIVELLHEHWPSERLGYYDRRKGLYCYRESSRPYPYDSEEHMFCHVDESVREISKSIRIPGDAEEFVRRIREATEATTYEDTGMIVWDDVLDDYTLSLFPNKEVGKWPAFLLRAESTEPQSFKVSLDQLTQKLSTEEKEKVQQRLSISNLEKEARRWNYSYLLPKDNLLGAYMRIVRGLFEEENIYGNPEILSAIQKKSEAPPRIHWLGCITLDAPFVHPSGESTNLVQYYDHTGLMRKNIGVLANLAFLKFKTPQDDLSEFILTQMSLTSTIYRSSADLALARSFFYKQSFPVRRNGKIIGAVLDAYEFGRENQVVSLCSTPANECADYWRHSLGTYWRRDDFSSTVNHDYYSKTDIHVDGLTRRLQLVRSSTGSFRTKYLFESPQNTTPSRWAVITSDGDKSRDKKRLDKESLDKVLSQEPYASAYSAAKETVARRTIDL